LTLPDSVLSLDFGGTQIRTAVTLADGTLIGRRASRTPRHRDEIVEVCVKQLRETLAEADGAGPGPQDLAISAPGPLDPYRGVLLTPPNLDRSLWDFPFAKTVGDAVGLPAVMAVDTQVAVLAEGAFGAGVGLADYIYMTVSTGVGGGVVSGGRLLRGADGLAGEIGHLTIDMNGPLCGCGMPGHLESFASGTGISKRAKEAGLTGSGGRDIEAREVADLEDRGDPAAAEIMEDARRAFAAAIVSITDVFNPSRIIVGGGIAIGQGERLFGPAREALKRSGYTRQAERVEVVPAQLGDDVGLVGGLSLVSLARLGDDGDLQATVGRRRSAGSRPLRAQPGS
jgi:glucokinase